MATKFHKQYAKPGSKINPFTGKPYTAAEKVKVHQQTLARDKKAREAKAAAAQKSAAQQQKKDKISRVVKTGIPRNLINESRERFDTVDSTLANNLAIEVMEGRMSQEQALEQIRRGAAVTDPNKKRVGLDVSAELDPQLNAIERRRKLAQETFDRTLTQDRTEAERNAAQTRGIYEALLRRIQGSNSEIANNYKDISGNINNLYSSMIQRTDTATDDANARLAAQVAGMQGGTTEGQTGMLKDQDTFASIAGIQNQGIQGILAAQAMGDQSMNQGQLVYTGHRGAEQQAQIMQALTERAAALRAEYGAEDYELGGQYADLEESRYSQLYEGQRSLEDQQAQAIADAEDRAYEREMAERALGIKEYTAETGRYAVDAATERHNAKLRQDALAEANRHNIEVQRLQIEKEKLTDPLQRQLVQAKIDSENAKATEAMAKAKKASQPQGADGKPDRYTQAMSVIANIPGIRPDQVNYLQRLVDSAAARADYDKFFITRGNEWMMNELDSSGNQNDATRRYARQALAILLGVV